MFPLLLFTLRGVDGGLELGSYVVNNTQHIIQSVILMGLSLWYTIIITNTLHTEYRTTNKLEQQVPCVLDDAQSNCENCHFHK